MREALELKGRSGRERNGKTKRTNKQTKKQDENERQRLFRESLQMSVCIS